MADAAEQLSSCALKHICMLLAGISERLYGGTAAVRMRDANEQDFSVGLTVGGDTVTFGRRAGTDSLYVLHGDVTYAVDVGESKFWSFFSGTEGRFWSGNGQRAIDFVFDSGKVFFPVETSRLKSDTDCSCNSTESRVIKDVLSDYAAGDRSIVGDNVVDKHSLTFFFYQRLGSSTYSLFFLFKVMLIFSPGPEA
jgi:hypothetical protein